MIEADDFDDDPWLRQFLAGQRAKEERARSLVWGCLPLLILVPIMILLAIFGARAAEPAAYSCAEVRAAVQWYGSVAAARRAAKRKGATAEQIAAAEKCL